MVDEEFQPVLLQGRQPAEADATPSCYHAAKRGVRGHAEIRDRFERYPIQVKITIDKEDIQLGGRVIMAACLGHVGERKSLRVNIDDLPDRIIMGTQGYVSTLAYPKAGRSPALGTFRCACAHLSILTFQFF
jgi:hypothetical protein